MKARSSISLYLQLWRGDDPWILVWEIGLNFTADYSTCNNTRCVVNYELPSDMEVVTKKGDFIGFFAFGNLGNIPRVYTKGSQTPYFRLDHESDCIHREIPRPNNTEFLYGDSFPLISFDFENVVKKNETPTQATRWKEICRSTDEDTGDSHYLPIVITAIVALLSCLLITAVIVLAAIYYKTRMKAYDAMTSSELLTTYHRMQDSYPYYHRLQSVDEMKSQFSGSYMAISEEYDPIEVPFRTPCTDLVEISAQLSNLEISPTSVELGKEIGSGQFGTVFHGVWNHDDQVEQVAVKILHDGATEMDRIKLLKEAAIIEQFSHANIVKLCGVVISEDPVMILLEYLSKGNLSNFLISIRPKEGEPVGQHIPQMLLGFACDVGRGMNYLSNKCFIHRDLAARNVILTENNVCKVADFGMSRDLENDHYYVTQGGFVPFKWTAPEALLYRTYTTASDVWSYGILLYEMWSLGQKPYEDYDNTEVLDKLEKGYRLPPPPGCPREIYCVMIQCWNPQHKLRPTFSNVLRVMSQPSYVLFHWFEEDKQAAGSKCDVIGAPIEAGHSLYPDLQNIYR
ncbi:ephrin type-A receptor 2-like isoform X2 [Dysidea avara]|uniref:ephrin type-A receptor 2-like isoform X2 n=1 Tax=Dysidea avara TaxID=196820 RepID=UPI0033194257